MKQIKDLVIRDAEPDDTPQILELLRASLGQGSAPRTAELWSWKHLQNPFGTSPALVALVGGEMIALRAFLRWRLRVGERTLEAVRPVDTAVDPGFQRRGLFSHLTRRLVERVAAGGCEVIFNTPNRRSGEGYRKLGWQLARRPPLLVRPLRPLRMAAAAAGIGRRRAAADLGRYPAVSELLDWPGLGELLEGDDRREGPATPLDPAFLRWRYVDIPAFDYRALWRQDPGAAAALVFRSRVRDSRRELLLTEVLTRGSEQDRWRALASLVEDLISTLDVDYLLASAGRGSRESAALKALRFHAIPLGPTLMTRCLVKDAELEALLRSDSWRLSAGDLELF